MRIKKLADYHYHLLDKVLPESYRSRFANWYMEGYAKRHDRLMAPVLEDMISQHNSIVPIENLDWLEIETINRCNRSCAWCPTNCKNDPRSFKWMEDGVFKKIIDDLASFNYSGCIALFCYNEPLMDRKIISRMKYVNEKLPDAHHFVYTNADLFAPTQLSKSNPAKFRETVKAKFKEMADLLDAACIDNYSCDGQMTPQIQVIWEEFKNEYPNFVIWMRRDDEVLNTKGNTSPNRSKPKFNMRSKCYLPFTGMYIDPYGRVRLCCQDALWLHPPIGDLTINTVTEVWNGPGYQEVRRHFINGGKRRDRIVCNCCDVFHMGKNRDDITKDKYAEKMKLPKV